MGFRLVSPSGVSFEVPADLRDRASDVFDFGFAKAGMVGLQPGRPRPSLLARLMSLRLLVFPLRLRCGVVRGIGFFLSALGLFGFVVALALALAG